MWFLLNKNCISQKGIRDVKSIEIKKSSLRDTIKILIEWTKLLFWADKVTDWVNTAKESIEWMKLLFWADEVAGWAQREVVIRAQIKAVVETEIKLSSFFLLLAYLPCSCLLCCCSRDEQCSDEECMWWNHLTTVQKSSLRGISTVIKMQLVYLLKHFSHSY